MAVKVIVYFILHTSFSFFKMFGKAEIVKDINKKIEPHREKTGFLPRRKQRRISASR